MTYLIDLSKVKGQIFNPHGKRVKRLSEHLPNYLCVFTYLASISATNGEPSTHHVDPVVLIAQSLFTHGVTLDGFVDLVKLVRGGPTLEGKLQVEVGQEIA